MPIGKLDHYSHQVFFEDPSQVTIELNLPAHEAQTTAP